MKKVSTMAAKPSKKILQQRLTIGLDLGDRNSWYCFEAVASHSLSLRDGSLREILPLALVATSPSIPWSLQNPSS